MARSPQARTKRALFLASSIGLLLAGNAAASSAGLNSEAVLESLGASGGGPGGSNFGEAASTELVGHRRGRVVPLRKRCDTVIMAPDDTLEKLCRAALRLKPPQVSFF